MDVLQAKDADIDNMLDFIARYVRKVHTDKHIRSTLKKNPGDNFLWFIGPSNIAYLLSVFKNGQAMWDQEIQIRDGEPAQKKLKPLFSTGDGKKREVGKSLWNNHFSPSHRCPHYYYYSLGQSLWNNAGRRYFDNMEVKWMNIYKNKTAITRLYERWDNWIVSKGKEIRIGDGSKTFHSVMGTWDDVNDDETGGGTNDDIGEYNDNDGYSDLKSNYSFHRGDDKKKNSVEDEDYNNGRNESDDVSESSDSSGSLKTGKRGKKTTAGISDGSPKTRKRGEKTTAGISDGSPKTRTSPRKKLLVKTGKKRTR